MKILKMMLRTSFLRAKTILSVRFLSIFLISALVRSGPWCGTYVDDFSVAENILLSFRVYDDTHSMRLSRVMSL